MTYQSALSMNVFAVVVSFAWDANTEPDLSGYRLYAGTTGTGTYGVSPVATFGLVTTGTFTVGSPGPWFFALKAINAAGTESGVSNELTGTF